MKSWSRFYVVLLVGIAILFGYSAASAEEGRVRKVPTVLEDEVALMLSMHPENNLMINAKIITSSEAQVAIRINSTETERRSTDYTDWGTDHDITLVGLRADTNYRFTALARLDSGELVQSQVVNFRTGSLPEGAPPVEVTKYTDQSEGGVTIFAPSSGNGETFWGVDEAGEIIWYLHGDLSLSNNPVVRNLNDGRLMLLLNREVRIISFSGEILQSFAVPSYHHDAILLDNGNLLILANATERVGGKLLQGDVISEIDDRGNTLWHWSSFDHLDTNRFPGNLANKIVSNGALDWTHSNSLHYIAQDNSILLSSRSQSWVVNIDHASGDVNWIMGRGSYTSESFLEKLFTLQSGTWMASQHAAMRASDGGILIYDNRNESEYSGDVYNSRAVKFSLDTEAMTAVQTWEYIAPKYTASLGDVDELPGGNILLCAGGPSGGSSGSNTDAYIIEVSGDQAAETAWEMVLRDTRVYRAERFSWSDLSVVGDL
ncbi:aryl-sulfate sulfotransferase [Microbulbifer sp. ZKSA006]|uniref:aryl-sulfate sulfotransferase n=1 Tax=Microbulbifer sp. ZKSA006 TaxID=3243390 RepID=UPI004039F291